jgi:hypothetical protein
MGFNRRKMEDQRRQSAEKEPAARRATDAQVLEDAERLTVAWNERQAEHCRCCSRQRSAPPSQRAIETAANGCLCQKKHVRCSCNVKNGRV